eukprot:s1588_g2.t1
MAWRNSCGERRQIDGGPSDEVFRARREDARAARAAESELSEAQRELKAAESRVAPRRDAAPGRLEATLTALQEELHEQRTEAAREARRQRTKEQEALPERRIGA